MNTRLVSVGGLALLVVLFVAANVFLGSATRSLRVDLTQGNLYTLSKGSRNIARSFKEPIRLTLYFSSKLTQGRPDLQSYAQRVRELLEEYASASGGSIVLRVVDPQPFTDDEDKAVAAGLAPIPVSASESLYFGLVGTNEIDGKEVIPFFDASSERFLEYDISRLLYSLGHPKKRVIGLITSLPLEGSFFDPRTGQPSRQPPWAILREVRAMFTVKSIGAQSGEIPADIDVLLLVHPKNLSDAMLYAIDQFVLKGGKLVACVDPLCEADESGNDPRNPMAALMADRSSSMSLAKIFNAWGVTIEQGKVAADINLAPQVLFGDSPSRQEPVPYVAWLSIDKRGFAKDQPVTGLLSRMNMATAGIIRTGTAILPPKPGDPPAEQPDKPKADAPPRVVITPLVTTTAEAMKLEQGAVAMMPNPKKLLTDYVRGTEKLTLAASLGLAPGMKLISAFPDGKPADKPREGEPSPPAPADPKAGHLAESDAPLNVVLIADCDFLVDRFWVQEDRFGQLSLGMRKFADNGDFLVNVVDNLSGSSDLVGLRARGEFARPFDRVADIQRKAEEQYRAQEQDLQDKLAQTQKKMEELQRQRPDQQGAVLVTEEQQKELDKFREEMVSTRKQLRAVQANLRKDIDDLGDRLKFINIALVPALVTLTAVGLGVYRVSRRRSGGEGPIARRETAA